MQSLEGVILCQPVAMENDAEADLVDQAYQYITTNSYPPGCPENRKRTIRKKSKRFQVRDGELFYKEMRKHSSGKKVT